MSLIVAIIAICFIGCIDELPIEVVPDPEGEVQGRMPVLAQQLRYALLDSGVAIRC